MATYVIEISLVTGTKIKLRVKDPKQILVRRLNPAHRVALISIEKGNNRDHVSFEQINGLGRYEFGAGDIRRNSFGRKRSHHNRYTLDHDWEKSDGSESVKSLKITRRHESGVDVICDLVFDFQKDPKIDGFDMKTGVVLHTDHTRREAS